MHVKWNFSFPTKKHTTHIWRDTFVILYYYYYYYYYYLEEEDQCILLSNKSKIQGETSTNKWELTFKWSFELVHG